jgi:hypothetical protein
VTRARAGVAVIVLAGLVVGFLLTHGAGGEPAVAPRATPAATAVALEAVALDERSAQVPDLGPAGPLPKLRATPTPTPKAAATAVARSTAQPQQQPQQQPQPQPQQQPQQQQQQQQVDPNPDE